MEAKVREQDAELKKTARRLRQETKQRERVESELLHSEARFLSLVTFADHHLFVLDSEGRYLFSNQKEGLSVSGELLPRVGRHQREFHSPEVAEIYNAKIKALLQTGKTVEFEHFAQEKDGLHYHLDTLYPIVQEGQIIALGGICRDITEEKQTESILTRQSALLGAVRKAQGLFISRHDPQEVFKELLNVLVSATASQFGFLSEVLLDSDGKPFRFSLAISDISWDEDSRRLYQNLMSRNQKFYDNNTLAGAPLLERRIVIANDVANDPRAAGVPQGPPALRSYMGIPVFFGGDLIGLAGVANRAGGYATEDAEFIEPLISACASMIWALRMLRRDEESMGAVRQSEALLNATQRLAKIGGWEWDVETQEMFWAEETYRIHDFMPGELAPASAEHIARSLACYRPEDRPLLLKAFRNCAEAGQPYDLELPFTTEKGRRLWIRTTAEAEYDGDRVVRVVGNIMDITERKRSEEILQARLRLSESAGTLALEELLQKSLDEAERITGSCMGFIHFVKEDQQTLSLQMWSTNTLQNMCTAEGKGRHYSVAEAGVWVDCIHARRPIMHNDYAALPNRKGLPPGHALVLRELVVPILRRDRIVAVIGVGNKQQDYDEKDVEAVSSLANLAWDIVLRKKAEEQVELQGLVLDQARDRVIITSLDGVITYANKAECNALKRQWDELIGKHVSIIGDNLQRGATQQEIINNNLTKGEWRGEVFNRASDGTESVVDLRTFLVQGKSGKALAMCGIGTDITERKKTEEQLRQSEVKLRDMYRQLQNAREEERHRIAREIHDELGQNLTALKIGLAWLKQKSDPEQTTFLQKLESMGDVVDATLQTVRRVSSELRPGVLDALGLAAAVEWLVRDFEKRSEIQCGLSIEPEDIAIDQNVATDVFRILQEALTNIARHAQASMVWVTLHHTPDEIQLNVADNGIGISEEKTSQPGSLGLLGIRERLLAYGGTLSVQGLPGEGTSIRASIPTQRKGDLI